MSHEVRQHCKVFTVGIPTICFKNILLKVSIKFPLSSIKYSLNEN